MIEGTRVSPAMAATAGRWVYVRCHCIVKVATSGGVTVGYECSACGNTNLRFIHTLESMDTEELTSVGFECAAVLVCPEEAHIPRLAENETKRKEAWRRKYRRAGRCSTDIEDLENRGKL